MAPAALTEANSNINNNNNWLSFSLSPMEMLANSHQQSSHILPSQNYFLDSFYSPPDWENQKENIQQEEIQMYTNYNNTTTSSTIPKLEDFFNDNNTTSYNTESTRDSSTQLTHYYYTTPNNNNSNNVVFETNSDDSGSVTATTTQSMGCAELVEPELVGSAAVSDAVNGGSLSLAIVEKSGVGGGGDVSVKKSCESFGQRTSIYRGVTRHRWTGRYEAHLWDNSCRREGQARKGRQVYLGGYDKEDKAARAYDLAALKYWGTTATTNFPVSTYTQEVEDMQLSTKQEFIASLRRKSSGFSRGASIYRGVTRHHQQGRWQARIGRVAGNKDLYLGTFATEEEAAEAYDIAAIKFRGVNAVTNFEMNRYDVDAILNSNLPVGGAAKRLKLAAEAIDLKPTLSLTQHSHSSNESSGYSSTIDFSAIQPVPQISFDAATAFFHQNLLHHLSTNGNGNGLGHAMTLDSFASNEVAPMSLMPQTPAEFYIWPHQSY